MERMSLRSWGDCEDGRWTDVDLRLYPLFCFDCCDSDGYLELFIEADDEPIFKTKERCFMVFAFFR
jgi:hypothetical protein